MATFETVETVRKVNLSGVYEYYLMKAERDQDIPLWKVMCFEVQNDPREGEILEFQWEVDSKVVGYKDGNPNWEIRVPFTEETAREELARWR